MTLETTKIEQKPLLLILGIRPDVIRSALIIKYLREALGNKFIFAWSGQHYSDNLKEVFFRELEVSPPDIEMNVAGATDAELIASMISETDRVLDQINPAATIFLGDTNTVMGSIACASRNIPIVHIEGTMRSYDWRMPEEKYRTVIDHLADLIYSYLPEYKEQGILEGLDPERIVVTGNPIVDILQEFFLSGKIRLSRSEKTALFEKHQITSGNYFVMTCHRRENVESDKALINIMNLAASAKDKVIFPAGYRTQRELKSRNIQVPQNVELIDPIGYQELLELIVDSKAVLTDSGTVVEETSVLLVPSIQMRTATERPQVYDCGSSIKFDPHSQHKDSEYEKVISAALRRSNSSWSHPFGDGTSSKRIVEDLIMRYENEKLAKPSPTQERRPVERNYGTGLSNLGDYKM